jgi:uncharacterized protein YndB with AHSA1/START domain/DNA-binding transcriptional ArsR family regulator
MNKVFDALADKTRRQILDQLHSSNGLSLSEICADLQISRPGVSKHLSKLEEAGLITILWKGREKLHFINVVPLQDLYTRWISKFDADRITALSELKYKLEKDNQAKERTMKGFVYQIVISATPDKIWKALREAEFTQQYWFGRKLVSSWEIGSEVNLITPEGNSEMTGKVVEVIPNKRLSYTWNTQERGAETTTVVFELEEFGPMTKLKILHDVNMEDPSGQRAVGGWTMIISGLKTLMETGKALPSVPWKK